MNKVYNEKLLYFGGDDMKKSKCIIAVIVGAIVAGITYLIFRKRK